MACRAMHVHVKKRLIRVGFFATRWEQLMDWTKLLAGKVALITGAASGIGRATARLFAEHGAKVVVADVNESGGNQTVESIQAKSGEALFVRADVGKMEDVRAMVQATLERFGRLDVVHSNAAASSWARPQSFPKRIGIGLRPCASRLRG